MADIATLGIVVDTRQVVAARGELVRFEGSARNVETATTRMSRRIEADMTRVQRVNKQVEQSFHGVSRSVRALQGAIAALSGGVLVSDFVRVVTALDATKRGFEAVFGSTRAAQQELSFVRETVGRLGLELQATSKAYLNFAASAQGTALEGEAAQKIFTSIATAMAVLGKTMPETEGALLAVSQMMSKGTVSAEELRGQLGERLPGAFNMMAKALGVTTAQLGKMLEGGEVLATDALPKLAAVLDQRFGAAAANGVDSIASNFGRLRTAVQDAYAAIGEQGATEQLNELLKSATRLVEVFSSSNWGTSAIISALRDINGLLTELAVKVKAIEAGDWQAVIGIYTSRAEMMASMMRYGQAGQMSAAQVAQWYDAVQPGGGAIPEIDIVKAAPGAGGSAGMSEEWAKKARELQERMALEMREAAIAAMDDIRGVADGVLSGFLSDLREGTSLLDALANAMNRIADAISDRLSQNLVDALMGRQGTTETGLIGKLFGFGAPTMAPGAANDNVAGAPAGVVNISPLEPLGMGAGQSGAVAAIGGGGVYTGADAYASPTAARGLYGPPLRPADPARFDGAFGQFVESPYNIPGEPPAWLNATRPYGIMAKPAPASRFDSAFGQFGPTGTMAAPPVFPGAPDFSNATAQAAQAAQAATTSFAHLGGTLQATTPQVGGLGEAIAGILGGGAAPAGGGIGGIFASLFTGGAGAPLQLAGGGPVYGRGSGTSDSIPARLSNGEYVVNAAAAAQNRGTLDAINSGRAANENRTQVNVYNSSGETAEVRERQTDLGKVIDVYVGKSLASGKHDKAMAGRYGLAPKNTRRA